MKSSLSKLSAIVFITFLIISSGFLFAPSAEASNAAVALSPSTGTFIVDSTFEVPVTIDTAGQAVNAIELTIKFPPDKLQLVSSSTGQSVVGIWTSLPKFNNQTGTVDLTGGIPNGLVASHGLITTLTFRAKSVGSAVVKIDHSKVLSNDGSGTEIPVQSNNSIYQIVLPPPAGPLVVSNTHPDQNAWYKENNVSLTWDDDSGITGYSYMISDQAVDIPDDIAEGTQHAVVYKNLGDGKHYFHIKALRNGIWGGTTHYSISIDQTPPAKFNVEIIPKARTDRRQPVIQFATTDATSGLNHYEIKIVPLQTISNGKDLPQTLFVEAQSPYIPNAILENGKYDVIVRAFDNAGNYIESTQRLEIAPGLIQFIGGKGLELRANAIVPWYIFWGVAVLLIILLVVIAYIIKRRHDKVHATLVAAEVPDQLQQQLDELQRYREKYGRVVAILLALSVSLFIGGKSVQAANDVLSPPLIKTINKNISNDELFYAGGFTGVPKADVILYLQNLQTGETQQFTVTSDESGEWFYRDDQFLTTGNYLFWGQTKVAGQQSPPSSQIQLSVDQKVFQLGSSKFSLTTIYLIAIILTLVILLALLWYIIHHFRKARKKKDLVTKQVVDIEASIRRGFAVLNRDLQAELAMLHNTPNGMSEYDKQKEEQLLQDMAEIEQYLSKEVWELEKTEQS